MTVPEGYGEFPLKAHLGMELETLEEGRATAHLDLDDVHMNPNGTVHGAVLFALVDTAMGAATMSVLPEGQFCASVDIQLRFIRPASEGRLLAVTTVLKRGKTVVHLQGRVTDDSERLIATAEGTFTVLTF